MTAVIFNKTTVSTARIRIVLKKHPELWGWVFSLSAWVYLVMNLAATSHSAVVSNYVAYCGVPGAVNVALAYPGIPTIIFNGFFPWLIMIVAMMFPLLNRPVRHVAFSVRQKDSVFVILSFLVGYTAIWLLAGAIFFLVDSLLASKQIKFIASYAFLLSTVLVWQPVRPLMMMKCGQTMPIHIQGWQMYADTFFYGLIMSFYCLTICWAPMAALILAHHNALLMLAVTIVIIAERYLIPHNSKLPGYAWGVIAVTLFIIELIHK